MTQRFPIAIWKDVAGNFTAYVLDGAAAAATDVSAANAMHQLKEYIAWQLRSGDVGSSDLKELEIREFRVPIRGEYSTDDSRFPVATTFPLRVTCVLGKRKDGTRSCIIPTLDLRFSYQPGIPVEQLVAEMVQQSLSRKTPQQISRELMPADMLLDMVHVTTSRRLYRSEQANYPNLESVAQQLGRRVRGQRSERASERDSEVASLSSRLVNDKSNILLLGESGVGKTTILMHAIRQALAHKDPKTGLKSKKQFWRTSGQRLIAGMKYLGQWEERCEALIEELGETGGVLCVESMLELVRVGGQDPGSSVAAFLTAYLQRGELRLVAESTPAEWDACQRLLPSFADLFQVVRITPFSPAGATAVLSRILEDGQRQHKLHVDQGLADLVYRLFKRYQPYAAFPGKSVAFVRHLIDDALHGTKTLTSRDVMARFQRETGLPERLLRDDIPLSYQDVFNHFSRAVLGQHEACDAASAVVMALKTGLNDPRRPLGVLLFCGPTGVGKTEMAKALSRYLFGAGRDQDRLMRLDMSEYSGPAAAQRMLMSADGEVSDFIKRMRRQPFCVVLMDEIEKASPDVHDVLLGVLDEGRLSDRFGRTTTFHSAVIVMTSNLGAERAAVVGFDESIQPSFERIAMSTFRPEFFNRLDRVITFLPLSQETIAQLAVRELSAISQRDGFTKANLRLAWSDEVVQRLAHAGYDSRYGARPLQRVIDQLVVAPLSKWLLSNVSARGLTLRLRCAGEEIVVELMGE